MKYYILFGPPGAGKGTQAAAIAEKFHLCHVSTGELLRAEISAGTELGQRAAALINDGKLVPDEVVEGMIASRFATVKDVDGFLLDGFPRTLQQAEALDELLDEDAEMVTAVISIMIPDTMIFERIRGRAVKEGRADDASAAVIQNRIDTYHAQTEPLIAYYKARGKYREVDGAGSIEKVRDEIFKIL